MKLIIKIKRNCQKHRRSRVEKKQKTSTGKNDKTVKLPWVPIRGPKLRHEF